MSLSDIGILSAFAAGMKDVQQLSCCAGLAWPANGRPIGVVLKRQFE